MIFHKIYNIHFHVVEQIIRSMLDNPDIMLAAIGKLSQNNKETVVPEPLREILDSKEKIINSLKELLESKEVNALLDEIRCHSLPNNKGSQTMPEYALNKLEKQWLKTISLDPRSKLFDVSFDGLEDVEPLYNQDDFVYFDRPGTSDPWTDEHYIQHFRTILHACKTGELLDIIWNHDSGDFSAVCKPLYIEYNNLMDCMTMYGETELESDYRSVLYKYNHLVRIPLKDIRVCKQSEQSANLNDPGLELYFDCISKERKLHAGRSKTENTTRSVASVLITDQNGALERTLTCFNNYQRKDLVCIQETNNQYRLEFYYDQYTDEDTIISTILSLGAFVRLDAPAILKSRIGQRFKMQKKLSGKPSDI